MRFSSSLRWLLLALMLCVIPASSYAGVFISVGFAPPALPVYVQPVCPEPGLMWTPGYWAYGEDGYYWVPGAWVPAPYLGALWTPGYWGWFGGQYRFNEGYWGRHIGYYGGVNYGFGYGGIGFAGGEWRGGVFAYNTAVMHVDERFVHTTYVDRTIVERNTIVNTNHVAYSGGPGGVQHQPSPEERVAEHESHQGPSAVQTQHVMAARTDKASYVKNNGGHPATLAVSRPLTGAAHASTTPRGAAGEAAGHGATAVHGTESRPAATPYTARSGTSVANSHETGAGRAMATHPAPANHTMGAVHTTEGAHSPAASRPAPAPHTAPAPHYGPAPHAAPAPHSAPAPHASSAPRPGPHR